MTTVTVKVPDRVEVTIPAELVSWVRSSAVGELCADMDAFPAVREEVNRSNLTDNAVRLENVRTLLDALGYADERGTKDVTVTLDTDYLLPLATRIIGGLGEEMLVASGHYRTITLSLDEVANVCERALWLIGLLDEVVPGWPEFGWGGEG